MRVQGRRASSLASRPSYCPAARKRKTRWRPRGGGGRSPVVIGPPRPRSRPALPQPSLSRFWCSATILASASKPTSVPITSISPRSPASPGPPRHRRLLQLPFRPDPSHPTRRGPPPRSARSLRLLWLRAARTRVGQPQDRGAAPASCFFGPFPSGTGSSARRGWAGFSFRIRLKAVAEFLAGTGPITRTWHFKYGALKGFFQFAVSRGHMTKIPLPPDLPKYPPSFVPYIYSREEIRHLLNSIPSYHRFPSRIEPPTLRALLLLLYGAGLRRGEALRLSIADVDLAKGLLTIRDTKFFKSRLVPIGLDLSKVLSDFARWRTDPAPQMHRHCRPKVRLAANRQLSQRRI